MPAASLQAAASAAYDDMFVSWQTGQLRFKLLTFASQVGALFLDSVPNDRPVGNWMIQAQALGAVMPNPGKASMVQFNDAVQIVYRICWAASAMLTAALISSAQATATLNAYNASFP